MNQVQKTCTMCEETKPMSEFKRKLTKRQSATLLKRASISSPITVISKRCRSCWSMTKRKTKLSRKEIVSRMTSGDIHRVTGEIELRRRAETLPLIRSRIMKEYWQGKRTNYLKQLNANLQKQVTTYGNRYRNIKSKHKANLEKQEATHHVLLEQHSKNYTQAKQIKKDLMERARGGEVVPLDARVEMYFKLT
jgi:hypothetical protein